MGGLTVSVVIPNHNYGRYIIEAIKSALGQSLAPLEVIVVDNGSTDDSRSILEEFKHPKVCVIFQENQGQSGARNTAIRAVQGELVAFLDADDVWLPEKLEKQVPLFSNPEVCLVYCGLRKVDAKLQPLNEPLLKPVHRGKVLDRFALEAGAVVCGGESGAVIRSSVMRQAGEFDLRLSIGTGWDFWRRMASRGEIDFCSEPLVLYRQHGSNLSKRLDIYAHDTELKLARMFEDPASQPVWCFRRRAYGVHRLALAGAFIQNYQPILAAYWGFRALSADASALFRILGWPLRFLGRKFA